MTTPAAAMPLSFPPSIYGTVAPAAYLHANLTSGSSTRSNGRKPADFRDSIVNANSLRHCFGSAVVRTGDTAVVCGIRGEILRAEHIAKPVRVNLDDQEQDECKELRLLVPNIEMATGASPAFLPGNPPSTLAQTLSQRMYSLLHSTKLVNVRDLRILHQPLKSVDEEMEEPDVPADVEVKAYWTLFIDVLFISLDGNPFDAAWGAMLAALANTNLPKAWWDADMDSVVCSDRSSEAAPLNLRCCPVPSTFAVFDTSRHKGTGEEHRNWVLADPDTFEESVCGEFITITAEGPHIYRIEKSGGTVVERDAMSQLIRLASARSIKYAQTLDGARAKEAV